MKLYATEIHRTETSKPDPQSSLIAISCAILLFVFSVIFLFFKPFFEKNMVLIIFGSIVCALGLLMGLLGNRSKVNVKRFQLVLSKEPEGELSLVVHGDRSDTLKPLTVWACFVGKRDAFSKNEHIAEYLVVTDDSNESIIFHRPYPHPVSAEQFLDPRFNLAAMYTHWEKNPEMNPTKIFELQDFEGLIYALQSELGPGK